MNQNEMLSKKMMHFSDQENGLLLLASNKGELVIARTKDAGRKWKTETISITGDHYPVKLIFTDALNGEIILEAMDKPQKKMITRDGGLTWSPAQ